MPEDKQYEIVLSSQVRRSLKKLPNAIQVQIETSIAALSSKPRPPGMKILQGTKGLLRIRVGSYRIIYRIEDQQLLVVIIQVGHRRDIYRNL